MSSDYSADENVLLVIALVIVGVLITIIGAELFETAGRIASSVIGGAAILAVAIIRHDLQRQRERELHLWREKQENYRRLLRVLPGHTVGGQPNAVEKEIMKAHVFAGAGVLDALDNFEDDKTEENLYRVVEAIKEDMPLEHGN